MAWGYSRFDQNWKSTAQLLRLLSNAASKGGNFLLNIGPEPDGSIPAESAQRLREMGAWMRANGRAIYATQACGLKGLPPEQIRCTSRRDADGTVRHFLHLWQPPGDGTLRLPGLQLRVAEARLLADGRALKFHDGGDSLSIDLAGATADATLLPVVELVLQPEVRPR
ncbi:MAG: alpha-L-fucosidase [Rhodanobacteraceae bacterium]|nr:alpha-L-fucosidase [Rhodanobacteraceae bacterium]